MQSRRVCSCHYYPHPSRRVVGSALMSPSPRARALADSDVEQSGFIFVVLFLLHIILPHSLITEGDCLTGGSERVSQ